MTHSNHSRRIDGGFTLVELLVVIGIIAVLASILLVVGSKAFRSADSTRLGFQLQTIEKALDAYKTDFGSFPTTDGFPAPPSSDEINRDGLRGARTLCKALIAPCKQGGGSTPGTFNANLEDQDGADGPGFRVAPRSGVFKFNASDPTKLEGKVYGPYIQGGAINWSKTKDDGTLDSAKDYDDTSVLVDANGHVILYYPVLNPQPLLSTRNAYIFEGPSTSARTTLVPMYRSSDNSVWMSKTLFATLLGDTNGDGAINQSPGDNETAKAKGKFILISAGRDGIFGPNPGDKNKANDDVTNIEP